MLGERDKDIALAKLMKWSVSTYDTHIHFEGSGRDGVLQPYLNTEQGLAQFAMILLKFPEVFSKFDKDRYGWCAEDSNCNWQTGDEYKPNQENILDEILRMHGIEA